MTFLRNRVGRKRRRLPAGRPLNGRSRSGSGRRHDSVLPPLRRGLRHSCVPCPVTAAPLDRFIARLRRALCRYGGVFVPETLADPRCRAGRRLRVATRDPRFQDETAPPRRSSPAVRPSSTSPTAHAALRRRESTSSARTCHLPAHKISNALGQALPCAAHGQAAHHCRTGAGQHGVATGGVPRKFELDCTVCMGAVVVWATEALNVFRMRLMGIRSWASRPGRRPSGDVNGRCGTG